MRSHDLILIQEHWLYGFEKHKLHDFCNDRDFLCTVKSSDDDDPITALQRSRGKGGTAVLWNSKIRDNISILPDGCNRLIAFILESNQASICVVNAYMPCRGSYTDDDFLQVLDEIREIKAKYVNKPLLLVEDLNASSSRSPLTHRDKLLLKFMYDNDLHLPRLFPKGDTYIHPSGKNSSQIDVILSPSDALFGKLSIESNAPLNTSTHFAVSVELNVSVKQSLEAHNEPKTSAVPTLKSKVKWDLLDTIKYQDLLNKRLEQIPIDTNSFSLIEIALEDFCNILVGTATLQIVLLPVGILLRT